MDDFLIFSGELENIKVIDNFFEDELFTEFVDYIDKSYQGKKGGAETKTPWVPGHVSKGTTGDQPWFWYMDVKHIDLFKVKALKYINKKLNRKFKADRIYFNGMCPGQEATFHFDDVRDNAYTLLTYVLPTYNFNWGGQIVFLDKDKQDLSVCPVPNRVLLFPGRILHRAQSFIDNKAPMRVSLAFKLEEVDIL